MRMLSPKTMTLEQEAESRAKAFHLLKKWTSLTFINQAVGMYRLFLDAYEKQLDTPWPNQKWLEETYIHTFLPRLVELEQGVDALKTGTGKEAACRAIVAGSEEFPLFGRGAEEWGLDFDPFFIALGILRPTSQDPKPETGFVRSCWEANLRIKTLKCTANLGFMYRLNYGVRADGGGRVFTHWTYESLFQESPSPGWSNWPPGRVFPAVLPPCPPKNESNEGQIVSGQEILRDGIYEPWFFTGGVGCPNYFLKGQTAHQYQPEGINELVPVRWRLLWEDRRYLDGTVPAEEAHYDIEASAEQHPPAALAAFAGDPCPQTGNWQAPRLNNRIEHVERGQPMPGPASTQSGSVVWYLQKE